MSKLKEHFPSDKNAKISKCDGICYCISVLECDVRDNKHLCCGGRLLTIPVFKKSKMKGGKK